MTLQNYVAALTGKPSNEGAGLRQQVKREFGVLSAPRLPVHKQQRLIGRDRHFDFVTLTVTKRRWRAGEDGVSGSH